MAWTKLTNGRRAGRRPRLRLVLIAIWAFRLSAADSCTDWPVRKTPEAIVYEDAGTQSNGTPFIVISQMSRTATMFGPGNSIIVREGGSVDITNPSEKYRNGAPARKEYDELIRTFIDYVAACASNWRVKTWQELLDPKCSACHADLKGRRDESLIQWRWRGGNR